jgi:hypothetical protein
VGCSYFCVVPVVANMRILFCLVMPRLRPVILRHKVGITGEGLLWEAAAILQGI